MYRTLYSNKLIKMNFFQRAVFMIFLAKLRNYVDNLLTLASIVDIVSYS